MKKQLLNLSACAVFLALASIAFADPLVTPVRTLEVPFDDAIVIDGIADDGYSAVQSTVAFNTEGSTGADADFTFSFQVAFDPQYLYIYGEILDDYDNSLEYTNTANQWMYDNIEIFLNLDTVESMTAAYDSNTNQLRINRGIDSIQSPGRATQEEWDHHWENTASGWLFETAVPWTAVLSDAQVDRDMDAYLDLIHGFDMSGADSDSDNDTERTCQTAWDSDDPDDPGDTTEDNAWNNRLVFGIITLEYSAVPENWWPTAIETPTEGNINAYPNPAFNTITFDIEGLQTVEIFSVTGVQVMVVESTGTVDISDLNSGLYVARIGNNSVRFVKE